METKCQQDIKNALQIVAVAKETSSPQTKESLIQRLTIQPLGGETAIGQSGSESSSRGEKESRPGGSRETMSSQEARSGSRNPLPAKRSRKGVSRSSSQSPDQSGVFDSSIRENNPDEGNGRSSGELSLDEASGGIHMHHTSGEGEPKRGDELGEDDDGGSGSYIDVNEIEHPKSESDDEEEVEIFSKPPGPKPDEVVGVSVNAARTAVDDTMSTQDIKEALGDPLAPRPKRLTGIGAAAASLPSSSSGKDPIKRGHRREYNFIWTTGGFMVESWCNPTCSRIKALPTREKCKCGKCPKFCPQCIHQETTIYKQD
ncbi:V protein [denestis virus]|uniref:Non-structural protein V n=1 Tax=denestis virus TaxID=2940992 RepID=A0AAE9HR92_9MONO|nr:V protein [denestis virus]